jgi:hypothetical protein
MAWFYRYIEVIDIWKGPVPQFWSFEEEVTPLWFWEFNAPS